MSHGHIRTRTGYVAIGFSDRAGMMGPADAYAGWVDASGVAHVTDFSTSGHSINSADSQQDATGVSGSKASGVLRVTFTRALNTKVWEAGWEEGQVGWSRGYGGCVGWWAALLRLGLHGWGAPGDASTDPFEGWAGGSLLVRRHRWDGSLASARHPARTRRTA